MPRVTTTIFTLNRILTRLGAVVAILFLGFLVDNVISSHMGARNTLRAVPGSSQPISGDLAVSVRDVAGLVYFTESPYIQVRFIEAQGRIWRGTLLIDSGIRPGDYQLQVRVAGEAGQEGIRPFHIMVFTDKEQLQASYPSPTRRLTGIAPIWLALGSLPLVIGALAGSFYLSTRQEEYLSRNGIMPIVRMAKQKKAWEIQFALGRRHGIQVGDTVALLNDRFDETGHLRVEQVDDLKSSATLPLTAKIAPSWWIVRNSGRPDRAVET
jgi:hypothetical protein